MHPIPLLLSLFALSAAPQGASDPAKELAALRDAYRTARSEYQRPLREAKPEERAKVKLDPASDPARDFAKKFGALAARAKGTDTGLEATVEQLRCMMAGSTLTMTASGGSVSSSAPIEGAETIVEKAVDEYMGSPALESLAALLGNGNLVPSAKANELRKKILAKSPHASVRAGVRFSLASPLLREKDEAKKKEGYAMMELVVKEAPESGWGKRAAGHLFERDRLQIGMAAPDFEAKDQDGNPLKLSDYRGKVVLLDFWGFW